MSKKVIKLFLIFGIIGSLCFASNVEAGHELPSYCADPNTGDCMLTDQERDELVKIQKELEDQRRKEQLDKKNASTVDDDQDFSCRNANIRKAVNIVGTALFWLRILVPIVIVIVGSVSFAKAVISQDDNDIKAVFYALLKKIILGVMIFVIPTIVIAIMKNIANSQYNTDSTWTYCIELLK